VVQDRQPLGGGAGGVKRNGWRRAAGLLYRTTMLDRLYMPLLAVAALAAVALAMVWPQGLGDRSPGPFGVEPVQRTPEMQAAMQRATLAAQRNGAQVRETVRDLQSQAIAPNQ
jgi:hypothetical protein